MTYSEKRLGLLFTLIGPGGVGKSTLIDTVINESKNLRQLATATTRPMRPGEREGRQHHFVTLAEFENMIRNNELIEWREVHKGSLYGVPRSNVENAIANENDLIADIEVYGAAIMRHIYPDNVILIFVAPPSMDDLETRLRDRGEIEEEIQKRLQRAELEMPYAPACDYLIINEDIDTAIYTLKAIIAAERSRRALLNMRAELGLPRRKLIYITATIPLYHGQVLCHASAPHFPTTRLLPGEFPHDAALRVLQEEFDITPQAGSLIGHTNQPFVPPSAVESSQQSHCQQVTLTYFYTPQERINARPGWQWIPAEEAQLSGEVLAAMPLVDRMPRN